MNESEFLIKFQWYINKKGNMSLSEQIVASAKWKDVDIVLKYKKYPEFKKELDKIEK